ncbi:MAG TPA: S41 family peptidase [Candidatus Onthousia faecipullorum]|uniref:S41 family peptidase n=1 Tax=Candidatus Onthousia faecipullorum TaxID=2840887 RepID=A0A9D1KCX7_9FIRM|nr:S41 family peptidase [Candidatus Onthousia faecipullorum]
MFKKNNNTKDKENLEDVKVEEIDDSNVREIIVERRSGFNFSEVIIIMIIAIMFGFLLGNIVNFVVFNDKSSNGDELDELVTTYNNIIDNYYEDVDKEELIDAGIQGMINYLDDPYATYFSGDASQNFNEELEGTYEGIGVEVMLKDGIISVGNVFDGSPASKVGVKIGDVITKVNDTDVTGKSLTEVVNMISGSDTKSSKLTVTRDGEELSFELSKETIETPIVDSEIYENNNKKIGYIKIDIFNSNSYKQFNDALKKLEKKNIKGLVIDVRDNPGGYLSEVKSILSLFLNKKQVLYQLQTKTETEKVYGTKKSIDRDYPVSVIINDESASASEILASAFKESYGSHVVGINSYGKGTVQSASDLNSGDTIKYTVQKWLTPDGNWVNDIGVVPTDRVETVLKDGETLNYDNDTMLQTAISVVSE